MRLFKSSFVAISAMSLLTLAGCYSSSDDNTPDTYRQQTTSNASDLNTRPGHYEIVNGPNGQRETPYKASEHDNMKTITHEPGGVQQKIWEPNPDNK